MSDSEGSSSLGKFSEVWFHAKPVILIGLLVLFSLYTNEAVIQYRMNEYNRAMEALSQTYNSSHALNMLARFELIKKRQSLPEEEEEAETVLELKLQSLGSGKLIITQSQASGIKSKVIGAVISGVGFILGKEKTKASVPYKVMNGLEAAYFYERSRKYDKAIEVYTQGLEDRKLPPEISATLLLHRGYCSSLMGDYTKAKDDFTNTSNLVPGTESAIVAIRLKELTQGLEDQFNLAKGNTQESPFEVGRQMFLLANYAEAAKSLAKILANPLTDSLQRIKSRYLYARAQEELGQDSDAVITYRSVIAQAPNSVEAKKANRRLYVLGKFYNNDEALAKAALKKMEKYQDFKFINSLKSLEEVAKPKEFRTVNGFTEEVVAGEHGATKLDKLDVGNLAGDEKANEAAKIAAEKAEAEKLAAIMKHDVKTRRANAQIIADPLRQEAIFGTIESNIGEMQFIYQKFMRKGVIFDGELTVRILIDPSGRVKEAKIVDEKSTLRNANFNAEILKNVQKWRFREDPQANGDIPVSFPLRFVNKE